MKTNQHKLLSKVAAFVTMICMVFAMMPMKVSAFSADLYKVIFNQMSIDAPITDSDGSSYLPVVLEISAAEDIGDSNAVYFLEGYLKATLADGTTAEGISGLGMTLMGPIEAEEFESVGSNAFMWEWSDGEGIGRLKYNIPLLGADDTQSVEGSQATGFTEVNGVKVGDKITMTVETVFNTENIPEDPVMSDGVTFTVEDSSNYPKTITFESTPDEDKIITGITLSENQFVYNGSVQKPTVTAVTGTPSNPGEDQYTISYENESSTEPGTYYVKAVGKEDYTGEASATYEIINPEYTVSFEMNGGTPQAANQTIERGNTAKKPADPTKENYTFGGWYSDSALTTSFNFSAPITADTKVYAKWSANDSLETDKTPEYTVTFETNGGTPQITNQTVEKGSTAKRPEDPTKDNYTFTGWYSDSALTTTFNFESPITADTKVYAKWSFNIDVESENTTTVTKDATKQVTQLVEEIVSGKEVEGMDVALVGKINDAIADGKEITVEVTMPKVEESAVKEDAEKVKAEISKEAVVLGYYDIDVNVLIEGEKAGTVTKLNDKITITLAKPEGLPAVPNGYKRVFSVVKVHNGVAAKITTTDNGQSVSCDSDEFSTYALTYEDVKEEVAVTPAATTLDATTPAATTPAATTLAATTPAATTPTVTTPTATTPAASNADTGKSSPKTGDAAPITVLFLFIGAALVGSYALAKKRYF